MQALRLIAPHTIELRSIPQPEPGPGEVLVRVGAAGACHSDLHILDAPDALGLPIPLTIGHENAGWVEGAGPGVTGFDRGQAVAVYGIVGCGQCAGCLAGLENTCRRLPPGGIGLSRDGGMAEYLVAPARQLIPIGDLDVAQAAPLTDAALTPYHAINLTRRGLGPGSTCVVIGVGGLGHMAVQILSATTATRIIAVDVRDDALRLARDVGAHHTVRSDAESVPHIRELIGTAPGGADVVLDCVGAPATVEIARSVVSTGGDVAVVGLGGGALPVGFGTLPMEVRVVVPFWGTEVGTRRSARTRTGRPNQGARAALPAERRHHRVRQAPVRAGSGPGRGRPPGVSHAGMIRSDQRPDPGRGARHHGAGRTPARPLRDTRRSSSAAVRPSSRSIRRSRRAVRPFDGGRVAGRRRDIATARAAACGSGRTAGPERSFLSSGECHLKLSARAMEPCLDVVFRHPHHLRDLTG